MNQDATFKLAHAFWVAECRRDWLLYMLWHGATHNHGGVECQWPRPRSTGKAKLRSPARLRWKKLTRPVVAMESKQQELIGYPDAIRATVKNLATDLRQAFLIGQDSISMFFAPESHAANSTPGSYAGIPLGSILSWKPRTVLWTKTPSGVLDAVAEMRGDAAKGSPDVLIAGETFYDACAKSCGAESTTHFRYSDVDILKEPLVPAAEARVFPRSSVELRFMTKETETVSLNFTPHDGSLPTSADLYYAIVLNPPSHFVKWLFWNPSAPASG